MNALFYSLDGQERKGPVTKDEFSQLGLPANTLVWFEGQSNWVKAGEVPDLMEFVQSTSHEVNQHYPPSDRPTVYESRVSTVPANSISINKSTLKYALFGIGGLVILFLLVKFVKGNSDHSPEREPFVQTYASNFAARLMKATYSFSGRNPTYEVKNWEYDDGIYTIDMNTSWSGSCTIFDNPCEVGWSVRLTVTENGTFQKYDITGRNDCAVGHQVCETALGTVMDTFRNQSLK